MVKLVVLAVIATGCYRPAAEQSCTIACTREDQRCPDDTTCGLDNLCHDTNGPACSDGGVYPCYAIGFSGFAQVCPDPSTVPDTLVLPTVTDPAASGVQDLDTTQAACGHYTQSDGSPVCVLIAKTITLPDGIIRPVGGPPLALVATQTLIVPPTALVDAGNNHTVANAGVVEVGCRVEAATGIDGGAGGAFGGASGRGGKSTFGTNQPGEIAFAPLPATLLRGGCPGHAGGSAGGGAGGRGGGAVYLVAGNLLQVYGTILAGGEGGDAGGEGGAGGGGSGGTIALEAPTIQIDPMARVLALGGGGACGNDGTHTGGGPGPDASLLSAGFTPGGGPSMNSNVDGGVGGRSGTARMTGQASIAPTPNGQDGGNAIDDISAAGGGGGGGDGIFYVVSPTEPSVPDTTLITPYTYVHVD